MHVAHQQSKIALEETNIANEKCIYSSKYTGVYEKSKVWIISKKLAVAIFKWLVGWKDGGQNFVFENVNFFSE